MKRIYLDNAATTKVSKNAVEAMQPFFVEEYGNPSSIHSYGRTAHKALEYARKSIAEKVNAESEELIFTSGGTESNNLALIGCAYANSSRGKHIITSKIEHGSILEPCRFLEKNGFEITYVGVDEDGIINPQKISDAIREDTIMISIAHANNEVGTIQDIKSIGEIAREKNIVFHSDACQSFTKVPIDVVDQKIDLLTINSHKIHGPKGVGALYIRRGIKLNPHEMGGGHEKGLRSGTENVAGIIGFQVAVRQMDDAAVAKMKGRRDKLIKNIFEKIPYIKLNGHREKRLVNNVNITFKGIEGESLLLRLDAKGIAASTGSACSSASLEPSYVLLSMGLPAEWAHGSLRMTLSEEISDEDIDYVVESLIDEVGKLRAISPIAR